VCNFQQVFKSTYLFGAFSPITGASFLLEFPFCNNDTFQIYLNEFSQQHPSEFKIIVLDNGAFHKASTLQIPTNICLLFLPPYSPELNPAEKIWKHLKRKFTNKLFKDLEEISGFFEKQIPELTPEKIKSTCSFEYVSLDTFWSC
jgi:transposase